jgi:hypothetical protein
MISAKLQKFDYGQLSKYLSCQIFQGLLPSEQKTRFPGAILAESLDLSSDRLPFPQRENPRRRSRLHGADVGDSS